MSVLDATFSNSVTVYSRRRAGKLDTWIRTPVLGASWYGHQGARVGDSGLITADQFVVRIRERCLSNYMRPDDWKALVELDGKWTVQMGDIVVKGIVDDEVVGGNITAVTGKYTDCFTVTGVFDNRRIALKHLRIEGK